MTERQAVALRNPCATPRDRARYRVLPSSAYRVAVAARRRLSERELGLLTSAWCALPAVGTAGDGVPW